MVVCVWMGWSEGDGGGMRSGVFGGGVVRRYYSGE